MSRFIRPAQILSPSMSRPLPMDPLAKMRADIAKSVVVGGPSVGSPAIAYDYLITNDAEWATIPAGLLTGGGTVAVSPGNYTAKTITATPSSTLKIAALYPNQKPTIDVVTLNGASNVTLEDLRIVCSTWASGSASAIQFAGVVNNATFNRCDIIGNYRGTVGSSSFDVTLNTYPEYACILPVFDGAGAVASYSITRPNVGDLMADGTYPMIFTGYGGITFSVAPTANFTVSGGVITSTTPLTAGTSNANAGTGAGIRSNLISWTGQRKMTTWMPSGWRSQGGSTMTGTITFESCTFDLCNSGMKPLSSAGANLVVSNCTFDRIYQDFMSFSGMSPITVRDVFGTRPFSSSGNDAGDPHSDFVQLVHNGAGAWAGVVFERNIFINGVSRGLLQGLFPQDATSGTYDNVRIVGNAIINSYSTNGISISKPLDGFFYANAVIRYNPLDAGNTSPVTFQTSGSTAGDILYGNNIAESGMSLGASVFEGGYSNVQLGLNGATIPYVNVFTNHTGSRTTKAEIVAAYTPKVAYAGKGPFANTAYIDHVNRTTNLTLEPSVAQFTALTGQSTSVTATSEWSRIMGGPLTGNTISVSGGEYRIADDSAGTGATAWGSTAGIYARDKFLQLRHTTSGSGSTTVTTTATLRGSYPVTFESTTASVLSFTAADNGGGVAWSRIPTTGGGSIASESGMKRFVIACRFRPDVITANANIFSDGGAVSPRLWLPTTGAFRFQLGGAASCSLRPNLTPTVAMKTHIITLDFTSPVDGQGCYWATLEDGVLLNNTTGSGGTFATGGGGGAGFNGTGVGQAFGNTGFFGLFAEGDGGGVIADGAMEFFYMDWGGDSYAIPDITQSSVRNKFTADLIGANGSGVTGSQPKLFYTNSVANWNAGFANLGTITAALSKQAGTYT